MKTYYVTRMTLSILLGGLLFAAGLPWWGALLATVAVAGFFLIAPMSGRYVVQPGFGATALRRDERLRKIADRSARTAFAVTVIAIALLVVIYGTIVNALVPVPVLAGILVLSGLTYAVADFVLRRR